MAACRKSSANGAVSRESRTMASQQWWSDQQSKHQCLSFQQLRLESHFHPSYTKFQTLWLHLVPSASDEVYDDDNSRKVRQRKKLTWMILFTNLVQDHIIYSVWLIKLMVQIIFIYFLTIYILTDTVIASYLTVTLSNVSKRVYVW